jgi:hypothetical protein
MPSNLAPVSINLRFGNRKSQRGIWEGVLSMEDKEACGFWSGITAQTKQSEQEHFVMEKPISSAP